MVNWNGKGKNEEYESSLKEKKQGVIPLQLHHYTSGAGAVLHTLNAGTEVVFVLTYIYLLRNYCLSPLS